ncbi:RNA-directed DNA polymerase, eukaryota [Tanacetum coccineum]
MGDFNEVRTQEERYGSIFNMQGDNAFNSFISDAGLKEVHLGGCSFSWCHKSANKMSKLDGFLISKSLMSSGPNIHATTLDHYLSDHRPILMRESQFDYGPIPFRFYHYWFEMEGFDTFVERTWKDAQIDLECEVSHDEIKRAAWDCGTDKSPGPDGFTFGFYRRYWSFLEKDVEQAV